MFRYLLLSDIHLGHATIQTKDIVNHLDTFFLKYKKKIIGLDAIFITGDVFDRLLNINSEDAILAFNWLTRLYKFCSKFKIHLRILEGTPSHDWKQVSLLSNFISEIDNTDLYKYFSSMEIEFINNISVLYIPDEYKERVEDVYSEIEDLLKKYNLKKVDLIMMHGNFRYQLPVELPYMFDEERMSSYVNHLINIGHIHSHSKLGKILAPGSFERLNHSDDDMKKYGFIVTIKEDNTSNVEYLENKEVFTFKTISYKDIDKICSKLSDRSYIAVKEANNIDLSEYKLKYPHIVFTKAKSNKIDVSTTATITKKLASYKIDKTYIINYLSNRLNLDTDIIKEKIDDL